MQHEIQAWSSVVMKSLGFFSLLEHLRIDLTRVLSCQLGQVLSWSILGLILGGFWRPFEMSIELSSLLEHLRTDFGRILALVWGVNWAKLASMGASWECNLGSF